MNKFDVIFVLLGLGSLVYAFFAWRNPRLALRGRAGRRLTFLFGEEKAMLVGRYLGVPLTVLLGLGFLIGGATGKLRPEPKAKPHGEHP